MPDKVLEFKQYEAGEDLGNTKRAQHFNKVKRTFKGERKGGNHVVCTIVPEIPLSLSFERRSATQATIPPAKFCTFHGEEKRFSVISIFFPSSNLTVSDFIFSSRSWRS